MYKKKDIEQLAREELRGAEQQPPAEAWEQLQGRLATAGGSAVPHGAGTRGAANWLRTGAIATLATGIVAATVIALAMPKDKEAPALVAQQMTVATAAEPAPQATVAEPAPAAAGTSQKTAASPTLAQPAAAGTPKAEGSRPAASQPAAPAPRRAEATATDETYDDSEPDLLFDKLPAADKSPAEGVMTDSEVPTAADKPAAPVAAAVNLQIPNLITPNGDSYNDCWVIAGLEKYNQVQVQIFTARRQRVYSSSNYRNDFCGSDLPDGDYFYIITISDKNYIHRGVLVIKR